MYIPTAEEVGQMNWVSQEDADRFEQYVSGDRYIRGGGARWGCGSHSDRGVNYHAAKAAAVSSSSL